MSLLSVLVLVDVVDVDVLVALPSVSDTAAAVAAATSLNMGPTGGRVNGAGVGASVHCILQVQGQRDISSDNSPSEKATIVLASKQLLKT